MQKTLGWRGAEKAIPSKEAMVQLELERRPQVPARGRRPMQTAARTGLGVGGALDDLIMPAFSTEV